MIVGRRISACLIAVASLLACSPGLAPVFEIADSGVAPADATTGPCQTRTQCAQGLVCSATTGDCVSPSDDACGLPAATDGSRSLLESCTLPDCAERCTLPECAELCAPPLACGAGLVCVASDFGRIEKPDGSAGFAALEGTCLPACDPCGDNETCPPATECFALAAQGGFCSPALTGRGEVCSGSVVCAGALVCMSERCSALCTPDDPSVGAIAAPGVGGTSVDCSSGEVCAQKGPIATVGEVFSCQVGTIAPWGTLCGGEPIPALCPSGCLDKSVGVIVPGGVCSPPCDVEACPDDLDCFALSYQTNAGTTSWSACIRDAALPSGRSCSEDRNCGAFLTCQEISRPGTVEGFIGKVCDL